MGRKAIDLTGKRYGRLIVLERVGTDKQRRATWKCLCDCGNKRVIAGVNMTRGKTRSCGCLAKEALQKGKEAAAYKKADRLRQERMHEQYETGGHWWQHD